MLSIRATVFKLVLLFFLVGCESIPNAVAVTSHSFNDVEFRVVSCEITADRSAICKFTITNSFRDKKIGIDRRITIQDDQGNDYAVSTGGFGDVSVNRSQWFQTALADSSYNLTVIATNLSTRAKTVRAVVFKRLGVLTPQGQTIGYRDDVIFAKPRMISNTNSKTSNMSSSTKKTEKLFSNKEEWMVVGYWNYDAVDGQYLVNGLVIVPAAGSGLGQKWESHLELKNHAQLSSRARTLWPVKLNIGLRKVCANYPNYPSYQAHIDMPGESGDGIYSFSQCVGDN